MLKHWQAASSSGLQSLLANLPASCIRNPAIRIHIPYTVWDTHQLQLQEVPDILVCPHTSLANQTRLSRKGLQKHLPDGLLEFAGQQLQLVYCSHQASHFFNSARSSAYSLLTSDSLVGIFRASHMSLFDSPSTSKTVLLWSAAAGAAAAVGAAVYWANRTHVYEQIVPIQVRRSAW